MAKPQETGFGGEYSLLATLKRHGFNCQHMGVYNPFDVLVDGKIRIEVKSASMNRHGEWKFNIHRHGVLDESEVDFYVFRLDGIPHHPNGAHLMAKAPLGTKVFRVSIRSLLTGVHNHLVTQFYDFLHRKTIAPHA